MKKKYLNPQTTVIAVATTQIIAGSPQGTLDNNQSITNSDDFGSRGDGGWDYED